MGIDRRRFLCLSLLAAGAMVSGVWRLAGRAPPAFAVALRSGTFPGRLRPLNGAEVAKPAKWAG